MGDARATVSTPLHLSWMGRRADRLSRQSIATVLSVLIHALLLFEAAHVVMRMGTPVLPIAVTLLHAAPPPPPGPAVVAAASAPAPAAPIVESLPVPVERKERPVVQEREVVKPKRPVLKRKREDVAAKQLPPKPVEPAPIAPVAAAPAPQPAVGTEASTQGGGEAIGGVAGGTQGGKKGGLLGGQGDVVLRAAQAPTAQIPIKKTIPDYPTTARREGMEGRVVLEAVISREGTIEAGSIHIVESQAVFDDAAIAALRTWRFKPGRDRGGEAVRVRVNVPLRFRLR